MSEFEQRIAGLTLEKRALLEERLLARRSRQPADTGIVPRLPGDPLLLSFAQHRLWFLDQLNPGAATYNAGLAVRLRGPLDVDALRRALEAVVRRHEILRTTYHSDDGEPYQVIGTEAAVELAVIDVDESELSACLAREVQRPFDLAADLMLRPVLMRLGADDNVLLLCAHHIASDGWSKGVLFRDLAASYIAARRGETPALPALRVQYADYALWQRRWLTGSTLDRQVEYWKSQLGGTPTRLEFPTDRPRPPRQSFGGKFHFLSMPAGTASAVRDMGREAGTTPFMTLFAAFALLLSGYSGQTDVLVGTPMANRDRVETEDLIGFFVNTVVLRARPAPDVTLRTLLADVREAALGAYAHQELPFEKIVEALRPPRDRSRNPLFQVNFRVQAHPPPPPKLPDLDVSFVEFDSGTSRFDLAVDLQVSDEGVHGYVEYAVDLFDKATITRVAELFVELIDEAMARPDAPAGDLVAFQKIQAHADALRAGSAVNQMSES